MHNHHCQIHCVEWVRENNDTHDLGFCVRNCYSEYMSLMASSSMKSSLCHFCPPLCFPLGSHSLPCSSLIILSNCVIFTLVPSFLLREITVYLYNSSILMYPLNEFRLKACMKRQMTNRCHFTY